MNFKPLTREEVARAYAFARQEAQPGSLLMYLLADLDRLRALVKAAEYAKIEVGHGMSYGDEPGPRYAMCPWCDAAGLPHVADCPAFTADGVVR